MEVSLTSSVVLFSCVETLGMLRAALHFKHVSRSHLPHSEPAKTVSINACTHFKNYCVIYQCSLALIDASQVTCICRHRLVVRQLKLLQNESGVFGYYLSVKLVYNKAGVLYNKAGVVYTRFSGIQAICEHNSCASHAAQVAQAVSVKNTVSIAPDLHVDTTWLPLYYFAFTFPLGGCADQLRAASVDSVGTQSGKSQQGL